MRLNKLILALLALPLCQPLFASSAGKTGLQFLNNDFSPRALGLGGAFSAVTDGTYAMQYNPSGLGRIKYPELSAMYLSGFDDAYLAAMQFGMLLPKVGFARYARPAIGISLISSSAGDITYRPLGSGIMNAGSYNAQQDIAVSISYSEKFFVGDIRLEHLRFEGIEQFYGINLKYIRSTLVEKYSANGIAADIGYLLVHNPSNVSLGLALRNLGTGMKYIDESTKLPTSIRGGLSWLLPSLYEHRFRLAADADFHTNENYFSFHLGAEYTFDRYIALRIGYKGEPDNPAFTLGLGITYDDMHIDIASSMGADVYDTAMASFTYKFSGLAYKKPALTKRKFRGLSEKVAAPVGKKTKARPPSAEPVMIPAKKDKSSGSQSLFLLY